MSVPPPLDVSHKTGAPSDWDTLYAPTPKTDTFTCGRCGMGWSPQGRVRGWNRCPHCGTIYAAAALLGSPGPCARISNPAAPMRRSP